MARRRSEHVPSIVSKASCQNSPSHYRSGRCKTWLKTKCFTESELTLLGIDRDRKTGVQRALLAKSEIGKLVYAGPAFITVRGAEREKLEARLEDLRQERPALSWLEIAMRTGFVPKSR